MSYVIESPRLPVVLAPPPFSGRHVLMDFWQASGLDDVELVEHALREGALTTGATILAGKFHSFGPNMGVSGVLVLAESHFSIHTWPEYGHATADMFTCGDCDPALAIPVLLKAFSAREHYVKHVMRGVRTGF